MTRYTTAYLSFVERIDEVKILTKFAAEYERKNPINFRKEINALCRGSIVLLSSHLEAYIKELGEITLNAIYQKQISRDKIEARFFYHISKRILDEVRDANDPDKIGNKIFEFINSDLQYWSRSGPFPVSISAEKFNKGFSTPAFDKINSYLIRFGYTEYKSDMARRLKSAYEPTKNMVNHLVDLRNQIAHGEPAISKTPRDIREMIKMILFFCSKTDSTFATWCSKQICIIR